MTAIEATAKSWNELLNMPKVFKDEVMLIATAEGLTCKEVDSEHVCMISMLIKPEYFTRYECDKETSIYIDATKVLGIMKMFTPTQLVTWQVDHNKLVITSGVSIKVNIPLIEPSCYHMPKVPKLTQYAMYEMDMGQLYKLVTIMDRSGTFDTVEFTGTDDSLTVSCVDDMFSIERTFESRITATRSEFGKIVSSQIPIGYFLKRCKYIKGTVFIKLDDDFPITVMKDDDKMHVEVFIAPHVEHGD